MFRVFFTILFYILQTHENVERSHDTNMTLLSIRNRYLRLDVQNKIKQHGTISSSPPTVIKHDKFNAVCHRGITSNLIKPEQMLHTMVIWSKENSCLEFVWPSLLRNAILNTTKFRIWPGTMSSFCSLYQLSGITIKARGIILQLTWFTHSTSGEDDSMNKVILICFLTVCALWG